MQKTKNKTRDVATQLKNNSSTIAEVWKKYKDVFGISDKSLRRFKEIKKLKSASKC